MTEYLGKSIEGVVCRISEVAGIPGGPQAGNVRVSMADVLWSTVFDQVEFYKYIEYKSPDDFEIRQFIDIVGLEKIKKIMEEKCRESKK